MRVWNAKLGLLVSLAPLVSCPSRKRRSRSGGLVVKLAFRGQRTLFFLAWQLTTHFHSHTQLCFLSPEVQWTTHPRPPRHIYIRLIDSLPTVLPSRQRLNRQVPLGGAVSFATRVKTIIFFRHSAVINKGYS